MWHMVPLLGSVTTLSRLEPLNPVLSGLETIIHRVALDRDRQLALLFQPLEALETFLVVKSVQDPSRLDNPLVFKSYGESGLLNRSAGWPNVPWSRFDRVRASITVVDSDASIAGQSRSLAGYDCDAGTIICDDLLLVFRSES